MDVVLAQTLKQIYTCFYQQVAVPLNITVALPTPDRAATMVGNVVYTIYRHFPDNIQAFYNKVMTSQVQTSMLNVFIFLVALYIVYYLIMATLRMVFRVVYNFVCFSLIILSISFLVYLTQQYVTQGTPLMQFILDNLLTSLDGQRTVQVYTPPPVVSPL